MSSKQKENNWGYNTFKQALPESAPYAVGIVCAIAVLKKVPKKKKELTDIVKNVSYSLPSLDILNYVYVNMIVYCALQSSDIAANYLNPNLCTSAFDQSQYCQIIGKVMTI